MSISCSRTNNKLHQVLLPRDNDVTTNLLTKTSFVAMLMQLWNSTNPSNSPVTSSRALHTLYCPCPLCSVAFFLASMHFNKKNFFQFAPTCHMGPKCTSQLLLFTKRQISHNARAKLQCFSQKQKPSPSYHHAFSPSGYCSWCSTIYTSLYRTAVV